MIAAEFRPSSVPSPTVWTVATPTRTYDVRTSSARTALAHAARRSQGPVAIVGLRHEPVALPSPLKTRSWRVRNALLPKALSRHREGEPVAVIARALSVPRETVRDWIRRSSL